MIPVGGQVPGAVLDLREKKKTWRMVGSVSVLNFEKRLVNQAAQSPAFRGRGSY